MSEDTTESLRDAIRVDAGQLRGHIDEAVRSSVEETLNGLLDAEATGSVVPRGIRGRQVGWTRAPGTMSGSWRRKPVL